MLRLCLLLSTLLLLPRCAQTTTPLGAAPQDEVRLADTPLFAHYLDTLEGAQDLLVRQLYEQPLRFTGTPTPTQLLLTQHASNPAPAANARTLRLLTYNVALLDAKLFGLVPYTATPDLEARAPILFDHVLAAGHDIVTLQEVWRPADVQRLLGAAERAGYWVAVSDRRGATDGLAIAVKKTVAERALEVGGASYDEPSSGLEFFPGPGLNRAFMFARFEVEGIGQVVVYNTHAAAFPSSYPDRMQNVRQLGLHLHRHPPQQALVLLGGDMNGAPYYRSNDWTLPDGTVQSVWFANTLSYPLMLHYGGLVDLALRGRATAQAALDDVTLGDQVPQTLDAGYCAATPAVLFTATDCNPLYRAQYEGTEFPSRIDYFFARDPDGRVHVSEASLAFTEDFEYGGKLGPLSDHYGQAVTVQIAP
jgi:endonuclease/exonuclease/phosphatase family metal-dependent hydrolase